MKKKKKKVWLTEYLFKLPEYSERCKDGRNSMIQCKSPYDHSGIYFFDMIYYFFDDLRSRTLSLYPKIRNSKV